LAFLHTITKAEGGSYYATNSGGYTSDLSHFPLTSDAAGAYQIEATTYAQLSAQLGLHDWSMHTQDLMGVINLYQTGAVAALEKGNLALAIADAAHQWAAIPKGSGVNNHSDMTYSKGVHAGQLQPSMDYTALVNYYHSQGGTDINH